MATVLSLAMKVTADASGLEQQLSPVDKALQSLGTKADNVASLFDKFLASTTGAADAQANVRSQFEQLAEALKAGEINSQQYAASFNAVQEAARQTSAIFAEGAQTTQQYATAQDKAAEKISALATQLKVGAIEGPTFERALASIAGVDLSKTDQGRDILQRFATAAKAGGLDAKAAAGELIELSEAGKTLGGSLETPKLKLNELSGIFAVLPGPLGEIAGRFSGIVSAGEGLARIFDGGIVAGFKSLGGTIASLVNPLTLALAGIAALGAAATKVVSGLIELSGRVESLANTAARLGTSFEFVQVLDEAAKRTGLSIDDIASSLQKFEVNVAKAREGGNKAAEAFEKLGISQAELRTTDPTALAQQVAKALADIEDPAERAALATEALGKQGLELLPAFASLDNSQMALERFSATISGVDVERLSGLDDSFDDIGTALQGLSQNLLTPFAGLADGVASAIADAIGGFTNLIDPILDRVTPLLDAIGAAFTEVGEVIYDALTFAGDVLETFFSVIERLSTIVGAAIGATIGYVADLVGEWAEFTGLSGTISSVTSAIAAAFNGLWSGIKNVVATVGGFIEQVLQFAEEWLGIDRGVQQATQSYEKQREAVAAVSNEAQKKAEAEQKAAQKAVEANTKIVDSLLEQLEIDREFGGDSARYKAAQNVEAIEKEIARVTSDVMAARRAGDTESERAGMKRLVDLDLEQARQESIASGAAAAQKEAEKEQRRIAEEQKKRDEDRLKLLKDNTKEIEKAQKQAIEAAAELERERIEELRELRLGAIEIADLRTGAGASAFLDLASGRQDPAIDEYRKQRKELEKLNKNVEALRARRAEILGGVG